MVLKILCSAALVAVASCIPAHAQDQQRRRNPAWPCVGKVDSSYVRVAEATGGNVLLLGRGEMGGAAFQIAASDRHEEVVLRAGGELSEGVYEYEVPLDSTIESSYFQLSMQCLQVASVVTPWGEELRTDAPGVEAREFQAVRLVTVAKPVPGIWKVKVAGRGFLSVIVKARTDLRLTGIAFAEKGFPLARKPQQLEATLLGAADQIAFEFVSSTAATLEPIELTLQRQSDFGRTYSGSVMPPVADFRVVVSGVDPNGFRFRRVHRQLHVND